MTFHAAVFAALSVLPAAAAAGPPATELFPPIERILGPVRPPQLPRGDLRDALADKPTVAWYLKAMAGRDPARRRDAVVGLGTPGNAPALPYLGGALLRLDEDPEVRVLAAMSLARLGDPRARFFLQQGLLDPDANVRFAAALALGRSKAPGSVTLLEKSLRSDPSWWVRYAAAMALGVTKASFAVTSLERAAREDECWQVRLQAALSLGDVGTDRAAGALEATLSDPDHGVRSAAALALGDIGGPASLGVLGRALKREGDPFIRRLLAASVRKVLEAP